MRVHHPHPDTRASPRLPGARQFPNGPVGDAPLTEAPAFPIAQLLTPGIAGPVHSDYGHGEAAVDGEDTPDNVTVASASYIAEDDRNDPSHYSTGHRKRKRERDEIIEDLTHQQHSVYGDELLDYFLLSRNEQPAIRPDPPTNFQPNWVIDTEGHTALHWAAAMGDIDVIRQLKRFGAVLAVQNERGETPFMRAVNFTNCYEKQTFAAVMKELFDTLDARDRSGCTVLHHAAVMKNGRVMSHSCSRYYLDNILNRLQETHDPNFVQQLVDAQDNDGNTAIHLAAQRNASKCIRALLGRGASTDIPNREGVRAEDLIKELNANKKARTMPQRSSSPFAPDSQRHTSFRDVEAQSKHITPYLSEAANIVQSRITSLVFEKFQDLALSYDEEYKEKHEAEKEARRILEKTQGELAEVRAQLADLEAQTEPDETAAKISTDAVLAQKQVLSLVTHKNRVAILTDAENDVSLLMNGDSTSDLGDPFEDRMKQLKLATELQHLLREQRQAETDYVEALGMVGSVDNIEKYRRLLKICLGPEAESLEDNVDGMIAMMEEEATDGARHSGEPVDIVAI